MFDILLQTDTAGASKAMASQVESVWGVLVKGGVLIIPLMALLAVAIFFFIDLLIAILKSARI